MFQTKMLLKSVITVPRVLLFYARGGGDKDSYVELPLSKLLANFHFQLVRDPLAVIGYFEPISFPYSMSSTAAFGREADIVINLRVCLPVLQSSHPPKALVPIKH